MFQRALPLLVLLVLVAPAQAQEGPFVYITYSTCLPNLVADADAAFTREIVPALNERIAAGDITAWGLKRHSDGGVWSRASYTIAPTLDGLMTFQAAWRAESSPGRTEAARAIGAACTMHTDYIWRVVATSAQRGRTGRDRAPYDGTTFFACGQAGLDRADALVQEAFVPVLEAMKREGRIQSWTWLAHVMGGNFTRMLILDTASPLATVQAWERLGEGVSAAAGAEFDQLCPSHQDYIWSITSAR